MVGETVADIARAISNQEKAEKLLQDFRNKGNIGSLVEQLLGIAPNSAQRPDFESLGVELKVTPVEKRDNGEWRAGERLVITMISYDPKENEIDGRPKRYEETHLASKLAHILLCVYLRPDDHKHVDRSEYVIVTVKNFAVPAEDLPVIKSDWADIMRYVYEGRAQELSEGMTKYLGACTKGSRGALKRQGYPPFALAKPRAFCLKNSYMTYLQNNYVMKGKSTCERAESIGVSDFEAAALARLKPFIGMLDYEIAEATGCTISGKAKNKWSRLSFSMMGLKSNSCEEFIKANIVMKTPRFENNGRLKESISLPVSDFLSVLHEDDYEDSALYRYFEETRFLFSVWRKEREGGKEVCRFLGAGFWGMTGKDLYGPLKNCWDVTKDKLMNGVKLVPTVNRSGGISVENDLPSKSEPGSIAHVRPHAGCAYHVIKGKVYANKMDAGPHDAFELPNGDWMTKQSFWLNNDYVISIVKGLGIEI